MGRTSAPLWGVVGRGFVGANAVIVRGGLSITNFQGLSKQYINSTLLNICNADILGR